MKKQEWSTKIRNTISKKKKATLKRLTKYKALAKRYAKAIDDEWGYGYEDDEKSPSVETIERELYKRGFRDVWDGDVFVNKKKGIVIKKHSYLSTEKPPFFAVPMIRCGEVIVQPLVKTDGKSMDKASKVIDHLDHGSATDLHDYNVGIWNGIPVAFDW